jgi:Sec7-like guanine-nucleotide exchange factor
MRIFLSAFRLPGEAQQIDRILVSDAVGTVGCRNMMLIAACLLVCLCS